MEKKSLGVQLMPISPMVRAWAVFLCLFDGTKPEGQQSKGCALNTLLDAIKAGPEVEDAELEKLERGVIDPDRLHDLPFLSYSSLHVLVGILDKYGAIDVTPADGRGVLIEVAFHPDSFDIFEALYEGE